MAYNIPDYIEAPKNRYDVAANMCHFLMANGVSVFGEMTIKKMKAEDQRKVFGIYLGKGTIIIDGENETADMWSTICFGNDIARSIGFDCKDGTVYHDTYGGRQEREVNAMREWFRV